MKIPLGKPLGQHHPPAQFFPESFPFADPDRPDYYDPGLVTQVEEIGVDNPRDFEPNQIIEVTEQEFEAIIGEINQLKEETKTYIRQSFYRPIPDIGGEWTPGSPTHYFAGNRELKVVSVQRELFSENTHKEIRLESVFLGLTYRRQVLPKLDAFFSFNLQMVHPEGGFKYVSRDDFQGRFRVGVVFRVIKEPKENPIPSSVDPFVAPAGGIQAKRCHAPFGFVCAK